MRIVFRVDSSVSMGSGHLMRCLTLANELRHHGAEILFICREHPGHLISRVKDASFPVHYLPANEKNKTNLSENYSEWLGVTQKQDATETIEALEQQDYDWLVVDHYGLDINWETLLRPVVKKILVIDDLANRSHDCDLLLDQNYFGAANDDRYKNWVPTNCKTLLGPRYALVPSDYAIMRKFYTQRDGQIRRVLVFFGASDHDDQTSKLLEALSSPDLTHLVVDIVIGANHSNSVGIASRVARRAGTNLHQNLPSLVSLMFRADLFIGAGGTTTWERMSLGLPSLVISIAENQRVFTDKLHADGLQFSLSGGKLASISEWHDTIHQLIKKPEIVRQVAKKTYKLVDGQGCNRLVRVMYGPDMLNITIRNVKASDEKLLLDWVNEDEVRKQSFNQDYVSENEHSKWFADKLNDPDCIIFIGEDEKGYPIGQVRFDINRARAEALIDISIESSLRGMGLANKLLSKSLDKWKMIEPGIKLVAEVRNENHASEKLFNSLKFIQGCSRRAGSKIFELIK